MKRSKIFTLATFFLFIHSASAENEHLWSIPDWSEKSRLPEHGERSNLYLLNDQEFETYNRNGRIHSLWYSLPVTGLKVPFSPIEVITTPGNNPFKKLILGLLDFTFNFSTPDDLYREMGLKSYPDSEHTNEPTYFVPYLNGKKPSVRMGITVIDSPEGRYVSASCTACHSESLFGKPIIGLTNKTPRANKVFKIASQLVPKVPSTLLTVVAKANSQDVQLWKNMQGAFHSIGVKEPQVLGLDTSLATVALSLAKRNLDPDATISAAAYKNPRPNPLEKFISDSKPLPWFTLKYKTRWLSDGSVVSGNPILTNYLWNEIGRGVDLRELSAWIDKESSKKHIVELTAAVFATTPPRYTDFFPAASINLAKAKRGQAIFNQSCFHCHGTYEKAWDQEEIAHLSDKELLETIKVNYPKQTEVKDVGTDPNRYQAMAVLAPDLNRLAISQKMGIKAVPQKGYVPPPLVGIWSRWPYFHNNSAPTLCDVISRPDTRRMKWYVGSPVDPKTDFDSECNGFPAIENAPKAWRTSERLFDAKSPGLTNTGHFKTEYTKEQKSDLIAFLKTL